jgi:hypothetical protein
MRSLAIKYELRELFGEYAANGVIDKTGFDRFRVEV